MDTFSRVPPTAKNKGQLPRHNVSKHGMKREAVRTYGKSRRQILHTFEYTTPPRTPAKSTPPSPPLPSTTTTSLLSDAGIAPPLPLPSRSSRLLTNLRATATPDRLRNVRYRHPLAKWLHALDDANGEVEGLHADNGSQAGGYDVLEVDGPVDAGEELEHCLHNNNELVGREDENRRPDDKDVVKVNGGLDDALPASNPFVRSALKPVGGNTLNLRQRRIVRKRLFSDRINAQNSSQRESWFHSRSNEQLTEYSRMTESSPPAVPPAASVPHLPKPKQVSSRTQKPSHIIPSPGEYVRVLLAGSASTTAVCRVTRLQTRPRPKMTVQWLYLHRDQSTTVDPRLRSLLSTLSSHEAVLTNHTDVVSADSIVREGGDVGVSIGLRGRKRKKRNGDDEGEQQVNTQYQVVGLWRFNEGLISGKRVERIEDLDC
jgi:hypothetical protein